MKFGFAKKEKEMEDATPARTKRRNTKPDTPKDPSRFLPLLFLIVFLFLSYLSWVTL